ncbi:MAG: c-type cytochrome [Bacteroidota bacterium]
MKKLSAVLLTIATAITSFYFIGCNSNDSKTTTATTDSTEKPKVNEDSLKKVVQRGEYLANHVAICMDCHSKHDWTKFSGPLVPGTEGGGGELFDNKLASFLPGTVYSKNITPDVETGIGSWTDDEIIRAVTRGISKKGDTLFPLMPYPEYNRMAKEDLLSIIAYLRTLKPIKNKIPDRQLMIPISMAYPPGLKSSIDSNMRPPMDNQIAYGGYLATISGCSDCHTPYVKGAPDFKHFLSGGNIFNGGTYKVTTANITPDSATGLGTWTEERFMNKFIPYRKEEGYNFVAGKQNTIMPLTFYAGMEDNDLKAIYAFLRTLPAVKNKVEKYPK